MKPFKCQICDRDRKNKDEICLVQKGSDDLPLMCVGPWAKNKHYYLNTYLNTVVVAMKDSWSSNLTYIDLFAGPGKSMVYTTGEEIDGSPIIAQKSRIPFKKYILVDKSEDNIHTLKLRCKNNNFGRTDFICGDCNKNIEKIDPCGLSIAFIDPFGLHFDFVSLEKLTFKRKMDLFINFPIGAIKRNLYKFLQKKDTMLDRFLGDDEWRKSYSIGRSQTTDFFINYYKKKMGELGYIYDITKALSPDIPIKNKATRTTMYYLIYFSKHPRGIDLFNKATKFSPSGQPKLFP
jgi:three-Cys-motif partner protein